MTQGERTTLELSGLLDGNGVGRIVASGFLLRPGDVAVDGSFLHWRGHKSSCKPESQIFDQFAHLWEQPINIGDFARNFGILNPYTRRSTLAIEGKESLAQWCALSKQCWTFLLLLARLRIPGKYAERDVDEQILKTEVDLFGRWQKSVPRWIGHACAQRYLDLKFTLAKVDKERRPGSMALFLIIERWIAKYGNTVMAPGVQYNKTIGRLAWEPVIDFNGSLLRYLGHQLILLAAGNDIFICSVCHQPYVRDRETKGFRKRPKPGEQNYCGSDDCIRERNRLAAERHRNKLTATKRKA